MSDSNTIPAFRRDWLDRLVASTLGGGFPKLILLTFLAAGTIALLLTPREEELQRVVPVIDVYVQAPGLVAGQVERQVTTPLEKLLVQIKGVEHIYSVSRPEWQLSPSTSTLAKIVNPLSSIPTTKSIQTPMPYRTLFPRGW